MANTTTTVAGIDTGKYKLDIALLHGQAGLQVDNTKQGHKQLMAWLQHHNVKRIGIEPSGGYERTVIRYLRGEGLTVVLLNAAKVRAYAKFIGQHAKNDKLDAALIAECTHLAKDTDAPDPRLEKLQETMTFLEQIEQDMARAKTRREGFTDPQLLDRLKVESKRLNAQRTALIKHLKAELRKHKDLGHRLDLVLSIDGIGERTALALVIRMPELGALSREQAAALAGLAPYDKDRGTLKAKRQIAGGRAKLRKSLYAAALPAANFWNKELKQLYKRLKKAGKPHKVALVAVARKLLIFANAVVAKQTMWTKERPKTNGCSG